MLCLPNETLYLVFSFVDSISQLLNVSLVCTRFYEIIKEHNIRKNDVLVKLLESQERFVHHEKTRSVFEFDINLRDFLYHRQFGVFYQIFVEDECTLLLKLCTISGFSKTQRFCVYPPLNYIKMKDCKENVTRRSFAFHFWNRQQFRTLLFSPIRDCFSQLMILDSHYIPLTISNTKKNRVKICQRCGDDCRQFPFYFTKEIISNPTGCQFHFISSDCPFIVMTWETREQTSLSLNVMYSYGTHYVCCVIDLIQKRDHLIADLPPSLSQNKSNPNIASTGPNEFYVMSDRISYRFYKKDSYWFFVTHPVCILTPKHKHIDFSFNLKRFVLF